MKKVEKKYDIKFITFALSVLVALVFFLMILLVGTDYFHNRVCYNDSCTCEDNNDLNTEEIIEEDHTCTCVTKENDSVSFPYYNPMYGKKLFDIYSINSLEGSYMTFKYNNKLYFIDSIDMNDLFDCATDFTTDKEDGKLITQGGVYECYTNDSDDEDDNSGPSQVTIKEFDVDVNNIYKVVVESYPHSTGEDLSIFFIYKNGKVDYYHYDGMSTKIYKNVLKSYKVKGIKVNCKKWDDVSCKKTELELTLQNGKTAKVNNFDFR